MALARPDQHRMLDGETLRGIERDARDLVLSLRALTALLKSESAEEPQEAILARILDAELNQLAVLVGEVVAALKVEERGAQSKPLDLMQLLHQAARRSGVRVILRLGEPVPITGDPEVVSQVIQSALAIAVRMSDGRVVVKAEDVGGRGKVIIALEAATQPARRRDARLQLLRRLMEVLGGRFVFEHEGDTALMKLSFRGVEPRRIRRTG